MESSTLLTVGFRFGILLVGVDDFNGSLFIIQRIKDFIESRITLFFIQKVDELVNVDLVGFSLSAEIINKWALVTLRARPHTFIGGFQNSL